MANAPQPSGRPDAGAGSSRPDAMYRMPAEWEPHRATWIAWPHHEPDWPGKFEPIPWVYAEIVRILHRHEPVEILCHSDAVRDGARAALASHGIAAIDGPASAGSHVLEPAPHVRGGGLRSAHPVRLHIVPTDRAWLRDSAPTAILDPSGQVVLANWCFNAWAKYPNCMLDVQVGTAIAAVTGRPRIEPRRTDTGERLVLEGGGIDVNGAGLLLVTEEWLLSDVQVRNPGLSRAAYEALFHEWLGVRHTIWLGRGCAGDDTHGHVDDVARFVATDTVVLAFEEDPADENHAASVDNLHRLEAAAADASVGPLRIVTLPYPRPVIMDGQRLPASYANFYIGNGVVLVPTFNDRNDRVALNTLAALMPDREVIGIHCVDLVWGLGTLHCLTQQEPAVRTGAAMAPRT